MKIGRSQSGRGYFLEAAKEASLSTCLKRHCGSVVVAPNGTIIGRGYNSPPQNDPSLARCALFINKHSKRPTDKTCCIHAEQRALTDALKSHPDQLDGATVYFASIDNAGQLEYAGKPYCTHCSKMALDLGLKYFALWHRAGSKLYDTAAYNELSYNYNRKKA